MMSSSLLDVLTRDVVFMIAGFGVLIAGIWMIRFGSSITTALNRDYARLPFRFQYPVWWHVLVGALWVAIGLLIFAGSLVFAVR